MKKNKLLSLIIFCVWFSLYSCSSTKNGTFNTVHNKTYTVHKLGNRIRFNKIRHQAIIRMRYQQSSMPHKGKLSQSFAPKGQQWW